MSEQVFTTRIVIPLFRALGYERVQETGGPHEGGKDLACWRLNEIRETELATVQVKRYKVTAKAADTRSFSEIVTQLSQMLEKKVQHSDGLEYLPALIYFVTPHVIDVRALSMRFEGLAALRQRGRIRIVDGDKLFALLEEHCLDLLSLYSPLRERIPELIRPRLNNAELIGALELGDPRSVQEIHTDLDFCLAGNGPLRLLIEARLRPQLLHKTVHLDAWPDIQALQATCWNAAELSCLGPDTAQIEQEYAALQSRRKEWQERNEAAAESHRAILGHIKSTKENGPSGPARNKEVRRWREDLKRLRIEEATAKATVDRIARDRPEETLDVLIDGAAIERVIRRCRSGLDQAIQGMTPAQRPSSTVLRRFLIELNRNVAILQALSEDPFARDAVGLGGAEATSPAPISMRLEIPIQKMLQTGLDLMLLGDAGAGKTTSLQMFAWSQNAERLARETGIVVFLPLARLIRAWRRSDGSPQEDRDLSHGIVQYFGDLGLQTTAGQIAGALANGGALLLDGLDEVIGSHPWLLRSILEFKRSHRDTQVVLSSRESVLLFTEPLPFPAFRVVSFTRTQRTAFVRRWLGDDRAHVAKSIDTYLDLNRDLAELACNPLMTTILCVLAESGISLPRSEARLYEERLRLLVGAYDHQKGAKRLSTPSFDLETLAQRLAFKLHSNESRFVPKATAQSWSTTLLPEADARSASVALDELIHPCNILVATPGSTENLVGFGHLRYQEHLAARELSRNRGINLVPLLESPYWLGALKLYGGLNQDVESQIARLVEVHGTYGIREGIGAMISGLPESVATRVRQRVRLSSWLQESESFNPDS